MDHSSIPYSNTLEDTMDHYSIPYTLYTLHCHIVYCHIVPCHIYTNTLYTAVTFYTVTVYTATLSTVTLYTVTLYSTLQYGLRWMESSSQRSASSALWNHMLAFYLTPTGRLGPIYTIYSPPFWQKWEKLITLLGFSEISTQRTIKSLPNFLCNTKV